jgi:hypothetical protein
MPTGEVETSTILAAILSSGTHLLRLQPIHLFWRCIFTIRDSPAGKNLFVPKVDATLPGGMDLLKIQDEDDLRSLPSGVWGIKEPTFLYGETPRVKGP